MQLYETFVFIIAAVTIIGVGFGLLFALIMCCCYLANRNSRGKDDDLLTQSAADKNRLYKLHVSRQQLEHQEIDVRQLATPAQVAQFVPDSECERRDRNLYQCPSPSMSRMEVSPLTCINSGNYPSSSYLSSDNDDDFQDDEQYSTYENDEYMEHGNIPRRSV